MSHYWYWRDTPRATTTARLAVAGLGGSLLFVGLLALYASIAFNLGGCDTGDTPGTHAAWIRNCRDPMVWGVVWSAVVVVSSILAVVTAVVAKSRVMLLSGGAVWLIMAAVSVLVAFSGL